MLMGFWKLQGLRKLCPLSLLSYILLSITLAIKISCPPPRHTGPLASPPLHLAPTLSVLLCSFSQALSGPVLISCQSGSVSSRSVCVSVSLLHLYLHAVSDPGFKFPTSLFKSASEVSKCQGQGCRVILTSIHVFMHTLHNSMCQFTHRLKVNTNHLKSIEIKGPEHQTRLRSRKTYLCCSLHSELSACVKPLIWINKHHFHPVSLEVA